ncbi:MAG: hypothetical protein K0Q72_976 [Armatimonadetes bacterium]|jgi:hypothetical protein|nr:hypothetical protein [Armatimonadota bacterium]
MQTLYRWVEGRLYFWEQRQFQGMISIAAGPVGGPAELARTHVPDPLAAAQMEANRAARFAEGFAEIPPEEYHQIVVQWRREGWAARQDLAWREEVETILDDALGDAGLGFCDGGTFGGFKVQVFCPVVLWEPAVPVVLTVLRELERLEGAVVAVRDGADYRVVFPPGHAAAFSIL